MFIPQNRKIIERGIQNYLLVSETGQKDETQNIKCLMYKNIQKSQKGTKK